MPSCVARVTKLESAEQASEAAEQASESAEQASEAVYASHPVCARCTSVTQCVPGVRQSHSVCQVYVSQPVRCMCVPNVCKYLLLKVVVSKSVSDVQHKSFK